MRIAILGTRGIPSNYGGFEKSAEQLALGFARRGHEVMVYNSHNHAYQKTHWNGIKLIHIHDPEYKFGSLGHYLYDYNCIKDLRNHDIDVVLQLGYTTSSIWNWMVPKKTALITNLDGLEWKRKRYNPVVRKLIKLSERYTVTTSTHIIADSIGIQDYLQGEYGKAALFIPYGAEMFSNPTAHFLKPYGLTENGYNMFVGRIEEDNSIEVILDGVVKSKSEMPFLVVGNHLSKLGSKLKHKYHEHKNILFLGSIYDNEKLNNLRYFSNLYFHGHTVGGTNPLLLEAMAAQSLIAAHDNDFNRLILEDDGFYFRCADDVAEQISQIKRSYRSHDTFITNNSKKILHTYNWQRIVDLYEAHFMKIVKQDLAFNAL
ncbi:DUF1972 domain-containing protein [Pedobacter endophyticus]|uniref:DUF1972 domain-containing protein n=1 Tax=Pedobacter endophyticus TaxID=2789740 RepID=A0A7S9KZW3_9SPHI|nr:DUF1972 domain-containing protein [Pedobacter endophyticus]QPH39928.1 DUF1972 domain-containing protein [Pedobacter endophyticus]